MASSIPRSSARVEVGEKSVQTPILSKFPSCQSRTTSTSQSKLRTQREAMEPSLFFVKSLAAMISSEAECSVTRFCNSSAALPIRISLITSAPGACVLTRVSSFSLALLEIISTRELSPPPEAHRAILPASSTCTATTGTPECAATSTAWRRTNGDAAEKSMPAIIGVFMPELQIKARVRQTMMTRTINRARNPYEMRCMPPHDTP